MAQTRITAPDVDTALRLYYSRPELSSKEIKELFGGASDSLVTKKKNVAKSLMKQRNIHTAIPANVNTKVAFEAWHIDIKAYETCYKKSRELGFAVANEA